MPLRKKSHSQARRFDQKENVQVGSESSSIAEDQASARVGARPLSPRLARCQSDNTQRIVSEEGKSSVHSHSSIPKLVHRTLGSFSTQAKLANLTELNNSLVREVASLRSCRDEAAQKLADLHGEIKSFVDEKSAMTATILELQQSLESVQRDMDRKILGFNASEERLMSSNADMERLNTELRAQNSALSLEKEGLLSEGRALLSQKISAEARIEAMESSLAECMIREKEIHRSLHLQKLELSEAKETMADMASQLDVVNTEKQRMLQEHSCRMEELSSRYREMEERLETMSKNTEFLQSQMETDKKNLEEEAQQLRDGRAALIAEKSLILEKNQELQEGLASSLAREEELKRSLSALKVKMEVDQSRHEASMKSVEAELERCSVRNSAEIDSLKQSFKNDTEALRKKLCEEEAKSDGLRSEICQMEAAIDALSDEKQELERGKASLEQRVMAMERKLSDQVQSAGEELAAIGREKDGMAEQLMVMEASYSKLEEMKVSLDKELCAENQRRSDAEESSAALRGQVENLKQVNSRLIERVRSIQSQLESEMKGRALAEEALASMEASSARHQKIEREIERLNEENTKIRHESDLLRERVAASMGALSAEKAKLEDAVEKLRGDCAEMQQEVAGLAMEKERAVASMEALREVTRMEKEKYMESLAAEKSCLEAEIERLVRRCAEIQEEARLVIAEKDSATASMEDLLAEKVNLIAEKEKLQQELAGQSASASASMEALSAEKTDLEASFSALTSTYSRAQEELEAEREMQKLAQYRFASEIEALKTENSKLIASNTDLSSTIGILEGEVAHIAAEERKKEEQNCTLRSQVAANKEAMEALNALLASKKDEIQGLIAERGEVFQKLEAMEMKLEAGRGMNSLLEREVEMARGEKMAVEERMLLQLSDMNAKMGSLEGELAEKVNGYGELESQVVLLQKEMEVSMDRASRADAETERIAGLLSEANMKLRDYGQLELDLKSAVEHWRDRSSRAEVERSGMESDLSEAKQKIAALEENIVEKTRIHGKLELEMVSLRKELEVSNNRASRVKAERDVIVSDLSDAKAKIAGLELEIVEKGRSNGELELKLCALQGNIEEQERLETESREMKCGSGELLLESTKACDVQGNGEASLNCSHTEFGGVVVEEKKKGNNNQSQAKSRRKKKNSSDAASSAAPSRSAMAQEAELVGSKSAMDEKTKMMRLALPVVLISAASSMVVAGIQTYLRRMESLP